MLQNILSFPYKTSNISISIGGTIFNFVLPFVLFIGFFIFIFIFANYMYKKKMDLNKKLFNEVFLPIFYEKFPNGTAVWNYVEYTDIKTKEQKIETLNNVGKTINLNEIANKFFDNKVVYRDINHHNSCYINSNNPNCMFEYMEMKETADKNCSFRGYVLHLISPFNINGCVRIVTSDSYNLPMNASYENVSLGFVWKDNTEQHIDISDIEFNRRYEVYATNPHMAYFVLTPIVIERLKQYRNMGEFSITLTGTDMYVSRNFRTEDIVASVNNDNNGQVVVVQRNTNHTFNPSLNLLNSNNKIEQKAFLEKQMQEVILAITFFSNLLR